jgi:hypothetical protein
MTDTTKRTISAAQIVTDIRAGIRKQGLMDKYGLSEKQLQSVLRKLRDLQNTQKLRAARPLEPTTDTRRVRRDASPEKKWQCPACSRWQPKPDEECPSCGIVAAKFVARQADEVRPVGPARTLEEVPAATVAGTSWGAVAVVAVVLVILGYGIIRWIDFGGKSGSTKPAQYTRLDEQPGKNTPRVGDNRTPQSEVVVEYRSEQQDRVEPEETQQSIGITSDEADTNVPEGPKEIEEPGGFVQEFTVNNFRETVLRVSRNKPVLVEFYSDT